jgi:hypothetical protein
MVNIHLDDVAVERNSVAPFGYPRGPRQGPQSAKSGLWNFNFFFQPFASLPAFDGDKMLRTLPPDSNLNLLGGHRKITLNNLEKSVVFPAGGKTLHQELPLNLQILVHRKILADGFLRSSTEGIHNWPVPGQAPKTRNRRTIRLRDFISAMAVANESGDCRETNPCNKTRPFTNTGFSS